VKQANDRQMTIFYFAYF